MRKSLPLTLLTSCVLSITYGHTVAQTLAFAHPTQHVTHRKAGNETYLNTANLPLKQTLLTLKNHYGVDILFEETVITRYTSPAELLNLNARLETNLNTLLKPSGLRAKKLGSGAYLILPPKNSDRSSAAPPQPLTTAGPVSLSGLAALSPTQMTEPVPTDVRVSGRVTGEAGEDLPGVSVVVKGSPKGTTTDASGRYQLTIPEGAGTTLVFSFVGYVSQEQVVRNRSTIDVQLAPDTKSLNEVVVVGYGQVKKSDLTGAVSTVPVDEIRKVAVTSLDQALQGRAAGVQITQNSGAPGGTTTIRIRGGNSIQGDNEPLYVIDGIPFKNDGAGSGSNFNVLSTLNPSDIESISVLKDASSTAIYGSRGANGVVIITTKRGKAGKSTINLDVYYGIQQVRRNIPS